MTPLTSTWVTSRGAARILDCRPQYVHRLRQLGLLTPHCLEGRLYFRRAELERYRETHPKLGTHRQAS